MRTLCAVDLTARREGCGGRLLYSGSWRGKIGFGPETMAPIAKAAMLGER